MGPAMPAVNELMFAAIWIVTWGMVFSLPAVASHALIRRYFLACVAVALCALVCGYAVAKYCESMYANVDFPMNHLVFALIAGASGLVTGMLVGIPFVLLRRRKG